MSRPDLPNKPLIEAILELKWVLPSTPGQSDSNYRLLVGRFSDRVQEEYAFTEPLPTSQVPDSMVSHTPQFRFRVSENSWPLVQIGPGIMTVNQTQGYTREDFFERCEDGVNKLHAAYPTQGKLEVESLMLRYINAVEFDFVQNDILTFLKEKLKLDVALPKSLFTSNQISKKPKAFNWQIAFDIEEISSVITLRFSTGHRHNKPAIIWETLVQTDNKIVPDIPGGFMEWLVKAHNWIDDWFFKIIEGDLEEEFSREE